MDKSVDVNPDSLDAAELSLDDAITDLCAYVSVRYPDDRRLARLVDLVVIGADGVIDQLDSGAHLELDFDPDAIEH